MKNITLTNVLLILGLIGLVIMFRQGCIAEEVEPIIIRDTITEYDTAWIDEDVPPEIITKWKIKKVYVEVPIYLTPEDKDSIIKEYYSKKHYHRELVNDSNLTFILDDSIKENSIFATNFSYKINRPLNIINNTTIINKDKFRFSAGASLMLFPSGEMLSIDIGPSVTMQKNRGLYSLSYGIANKSLMGTAEYILIKK